MNIISKDFTLSASHQLTGLPDDHPCARLHGHNVIVRVELMGSLNDVGMVMDYRDLQPLDDWLDATFDHRHLNDVVDFNPTAERMAEHIYWWCQGQGWPVVAASWSETPKTWATFR